MKTFSRVYFNCIDVQLTLNCNLNCHYCSRNCAIMNPLGDFFYNTSKLKKDFERIFNFPDSESICSIALLGGEPTLNKNLLEYIKIVKEKISPKYTDVITNGIELLKNTQLVYKLKQNNVRIGISHYPETSSLLKKLEVKLQSFKVKYYYMSLKYRHRKGGIVNENRNAYKWRRLSEFKCNNAWSGKNIVSEVCR